jgi:hypothetical protein
MKPDSIFACRILLLGQLKKVEISRTEIDRLYDLAVGFVASSRYLNSRLTGLR